MKKKTYPSPEVVAAKLGVRLPLLVPLTTVISSATSGDGQWEKAFIDDPPGMVMFIASVLMKFASGKQRMTTWERKVVRITLQRPKLTDIDRLQAFTDALGYADEAAYLAVTQIEKEGR